VATPFHNIIKEPGKFAICTTKKVYVLLKLFRDRACGADDGDGIGVVHTGMRLRVP
jgi:hypothetical protein